MVDIYVTYLVSFMQVIKRYVDFNNCFRTIYRNIHLNSQDPKI